MAYLGSFRHRFFNAFRELFLYHHSSLEFRAKLFAAVIAANESAVECEFYVVKEIARNIYDDDDRISTLILTIKEYIEKVRLDNGLDIDELVDDIMKDLKTVPRYAGKIDKEHLLPLLECNHDEDSKAYQHRIIEFLESLKLETIERVKN